MPMLFLVGSIVPSQEGTPALLCLFGGKSCQTETKENPCAVTQFHLRSLLVNKIYIFCVTLILSLMVSSCSGQPAEPTAQNPGDVDSNSGQTGAQAATPPENPGGATLEITEEQNGGIVALIVNDVLYVQLEGNPTTGFTWEVENLETNLLQQVGESEYNSNSNLAGGGGMFTFTFKALDVGVTPLRLIYHRTFEKNIPPAQIFEVTVDIQK
jgi:inhibitor of cysteine peptidase